MALNLSDLKDKDSILVNVVFYLVTAFFVAIIFSYPLLSFKVYLQNKEINKLDNIMSFDETQQKTNEMKVLDYKKKIDDYTLIINNHRISSNIFVFIEEKTLSNVWFSNFAMSQFANEVKLSGEAENIVALSLQVEAFEKSEDYVRDVAVLESQESDSGRVQFALSLYLTPEVFNYNANK